MFALNPGIAPNKTFAEDACSPGGCHNSGAGDPPLTSHLQVSPGPTLLPESSSLLLSPQRDPCLVSPVIYWLKPPPPAGAPEAPGPGCVGQWGGGGGSHSKGQRGHSREGVHLQVGQHQGRKDFPPPEEVGIWEGQAEVGWKSWRACLWLLPRECLFLGWGGPGRGEVVAAQSPHQGPGQETG